MYGTYSQEGDTSSTFQNYRARNFFQRNSKYLAGVVSVILLICVGLAVFDETASITHTTSSKLKSDEITETTKAPFCYDSAKCGPATWGGVCTTGKRQSPINIELTTKDAVYAPWKNFELNEEYLMETERHFYGQNNGDSAQFELSSNLSNLHSDLRICGGGLASCYVFAQFHFHWDETDADGSEHTINGKRFPLEMHIVHYKDKYASFADALKSDEKDAVAVMAIMHQINAVENPALDPVVAALETMRTPGKVEEFDLPINIAAFYPENKDFARYFGSLTTPPCSEDVVWTIFLTPNTISESQIGRLRKLLNVIGVSDANFRQLQPTNGREIYFFRAGDFIED